MNIARAAFKIDCREISLTLQIWYANLPLCHEASAVYSCPSAGVRLKGTRRNKGGVYLQTKAKREHSCPN